MSNEWTDELRAQVVEDYLAAEPTAETSVEILAGIAEDIGKTVNGVRMILTKAGAYIKATPAKAAKKEGTGGTRVSKQDSIDALVAVMESEDIEVDDTIVSKLTGKAAIYFTGVLKQALGE